PHNIEARLLNDLQPYLKFPAITPDSLCRDLPNMIECPFVEADDDRGPFLASTPVNCYFYTGYVYVARLDEAAAGKLPLPTTELGALAGQTALQNPSPLPLPSPGSLTAVLLQPKRSANARNPRRAPLWADDLHMGLAPQPYWQFAHTRGAAV